MPSDKSIFIAMILMALLWASLIIGGLYRVVVYFLTLGS